MRFEKFITEKQIDESLLFKQARALDDTVLGENTWLFAKHPLFEDIYYDVTNGLNEDELDHFAMLSDMLNEVSREEKAKRKEKVAVMKAYQVEKPISDKDKELRAAYNDIMDKSRKSFHKLDKVSQKSYIIKYMLHGKDTLRSKEDWGRLEKAGATPKEVYTDSLKGYKARQQFVKDLMIMVKAEEEKRKEGAKKYHEIRKKYKDIVDLEISLGKSSDTLTQKLLAYAKEGFAKKNYDEGKYLHFLWKIRAKQYNDVKELSQCIKQFDAIENNTKTVKSIDITTVCPKREKLLEMLEDFRQAQADYEQAVYDGASDSTAKRLKERMESMRVTEANNPTCAYCYVEQGREIQADNPNYIYAKAEKRGQTYQGTFGNWIQKKNKKPVIDPDTGGYVLTKSGEKSVEKFNKMGGIRFFSSGDYIENEATNAEIEKVIKDAEKVGLQLKAITKQATIY
jgi:hypothetical protein